jgi:hypothetical protein
MLFTSLKVIMVTSVFTALSFLSPSSIKLDKLAGCTGKTSLINTEIAEASYCYDIKVNGKKCQKCCGYAWGCSVYCFSTSKE